LVNTRFFGGGAAAAAGPAAEQAVDIRGTPFPTRLTKRIPENMSVTNTLTYLILLLIQEGGPLRSGPCHGVAVICFAEVGLVVAEFALAGE